MSDKSSIALSVRCQWNSRGTRNTPLHAREAQPSRAIPHLYNWPVTTRNRPRSAGSAKNAPSAIATEIQKCISQTPLNQPLGLAVLQRSKFEVTALAQLPRHRHHLALQVRRNVDGNRDQTRLTPFLPQLALTLCIRCHLPYSVPLQLTAGLIGLPTSVKQRVNIPIKPFVRNVPISIHFTKGRGPDPWWFIGADHPPVRAVSGGSGLSAVTEQSTTVSAPSDVYARNRSHRCVADASNNFPIRSRAISRTLFR